jgi:outer membrane protein OmpU
MKKLLLGSTALVAAGLMAGEAYAADGVKLGIGGRYMGAAGINAIQDFEDNDPIEHPRSYVFKQDVEVYFLGETTLDNGLTVGARIELEGQTSGDQIDAVWAYFSGGFGEIRFGDTSEALAQLCYLVPSASGIFGADSPNFNFSNNAFTGLGYAATNGTCYGVDDKSTKIVYFSPNFAGFSFAASFTPDNTEDTRNTVAGAATRPDQDAGQNSENLSVAANFTHDFNGINLILGGGGTWSFDREVGSSITDDRTEYNAYARVGFAGFTFGGAYSLRSNTNLSGADAQVYGAGVTYNWDAWTVGFGWTHGDYEFYSTPPDVLEDHDVFSLTASYALGPGIQLDGVVEYDIDSFDGNGVAGTFDNYEGLAIGVGTLISF